MQAATSSGGQARFDKSGRRLPDTGRGCGCAQCAQAGEPRYERRLTPRRDQAAWTSARRASVRLLRLLVGRRGRGRVQGA